MNRRDFVTRSMGTAVALAAGARPALAGWGGPKRILVLGGTGFLGPAVVEAARARGHVLTLFNRGRTEKRRQELGRPSAVPEGVTVLYGNRDPEKHADDADPSSPKGLESLKGGSWDAVVDTSGYVPRIVRASASMLATQAQQYVFISSVSAYSDNSTPNADETAAVAKLKDETVEEMGSQFENYGGLKVLCENAAEKAFAGRCANIRPGYIVGPGDPTDRFTYWPVRVSRAVGDRQAMLAPGTPRDPIQIIDVRDLGEWIVRVIEDGTAGVFNAVGPDEPTAMGEVIESCAKAAGTSPKVTWADAATLQKHGVQFPIWLPPEGETAGFHRWSNRRAVAKGLKFRSVEDTCKATLEWWKTLPADRQKTTRAGPSEELEKAVIAAIKGK